MLSASWATCARGRGEVIFLADLLQRLGVFRVLLSGCGVSIVFVEQIDHQTVAQSALRDENVVELQLGHDLQQDHASGNDDVRSLGSPLMREALVQRLAFNICPAVSLTAGGAIR